MSKEKINQTIKVVYGIVVTILFLFAADLILGNEGTNDRVGLLLIIVALFISGVYGLYKSLIERNKKGAIIELLIVLLGSIFLINIII
ncbi:hypothetical protein ACFFJI_12270 [Allobacillus sp. GCM10007491]|uniref:Uncharacterized protein n=1 Tax=Allobacillus saliphilus TaxID=2912308 RepID=A0A941HTN5_9BACI|nr:hypothetical protein [Allobacillus saliphilus]MBR7553449.1 hypothetical protein [Allobacillus saliphilus]